MHTDLVDTAAAIVGEFRLRRDFSAATVAAAIRSSTGAIYTGVCLDFSCGLGFCAEHAAVAEMLKHRESKIAAVVAVGSDHKILSPCGRCRELMLQVDGANMNTEVVLGESRVMLLRELLPEYWLECVG